MSGSASGGLERKPTAKLWFSNVVAGGRQACMTDAARVTSRGVAILVKIKSGKLSIIFYHVFLWFYKIGIRLVAPWNVKARAWLEGRRGIFERIGSALGN